MKYSTATLTSAATSVTLTFSRKRTTKHAGLLAIRQFMQDYGIAKMLRSSIGLALPQNKYRTRFSPFALFSQRLFALFASREDLNDHDDPAWREDGAVQAVLGEKLASCSTLSRFESSVNQDTITALNNALLSLFIELHKDLRCIWLDADSTPVPLYGNQEGVAYNGHYKTNCYLPLTVFANGVPVHVVNAPGTEDGRNLLEPIIDNIIKHLKMAYPQTPIIVRADAGFNRSSLISKLEKANVYYIIGFGQNKSINKIVDGKDFTPEVVYDGVREYDGAVFIRALGEINYQAKSWKGARRVIVRDQAAPPLGENKNAIKSLATKHHNSLINKDLLGNNGREEKYSQDSLFIDEPIDYELTRANHNPPTINEDGAEFDVRYVVTNIPKQGIKGLHLPMEMNAQNIYENLYCQRATICEDRIQELKSEAHASRASASCFLTNWYRMLLSAIADSIIYGVRRILFSGFEDKGSWFNISLKRFQKELINLPGSLITEKRGILLEINQALQHPEAVLIIFRAKYDATKYQKPDRNKLVFY